MCVTQSQLHWPHHYLPAFTVIELAGCISKQRFKPFFWFDCSLATVQEGYFATRLLGRNVDQNDGSIERSAAAPPVSWAGVQH